jgi:kynurenine formamidase
MRHRSTMRSCARGVRTSNRAPSSVSFRHGELCGHERGGTWNASPYLTGDGAAWIVERKPVGVAIDHFSIGGRGTPEKVLPSHRELLGAGVWIVEEALFPEELLDSAWQIVALPWRIVGVSGAPTRMIAIEQPR